MAATASGFLVRHGRGLLLALAAAVFLTLSEAFGTSGASLLSRATYWTVLMVGGAVIAALSVDVIKRRGLLEDRLWAQGLLIITVTTAPIVLLVFSVSTLVFERSWQWETLPVYIPAVLTITAAMTALNYATGRKAQITMAAPATSTPVRFLERFPAKLRGADLWAVQAEDHYLRLYTSRGSDLILLRLADAIDELEGIEGARTHRSWWVARAAIADASRGDGRAVLTLKGGLEVPVSRTYATGLREAGWF